MISTDVTEAILNYGTHTCMRGYQKNRERLNVSR